jgi:hypothetical protein
MLLKPFFFFSVMYWLCIGCKAKTPNLGSLRHPLTQLTLQKIGVQVTFEAKGISFKLQTKSLCISFWLPLQSYLATDFLKYPLKHR